MAAVAVARMFSLGQRNDSAVFAALRDEYPPGEIFAGLQAARRALAEAEAGGLVVRRDNDGEEDGNADGEQGKSEGEEEAVDDLTTLLRVLRDPSASATLLLSLRVRGVSPLVYACSTYDEDLGVEIVDYVQRRRAEVRRGRGRGTSGSAVAIGSNAGAGVSTAATTGNEGDPDSLERELTNIIDEKHDYQYRPLHYACEASMPLLVRALVAAGAGLEHATVDLQLQRGSVQAGGRRPLHFAARALGDDGVAMVRTLLDAGANPASCDLDGNTPYVLACMRHGVASPSAEILRAALMGAQERRRGVPSASSGGNADNPPAASSSTPPTFPPSHAWLLAKAKRDRDAGNERVRSMWHVPKALRKVFSIQKLLSVEECVDLARQVTAFTASHGWLSDRHRGYATTDVRSAKMPRVDAWVREHVSARLFPTLASRFGFALSSFRFRDLFFVYYDGDTPGAQNSVGPHRDGSVLSFNVLLNDAAAFDGGGTWFDHTQRTHHIGQGDVLVHSGKLRHAGMPITRGKRFILVGFVDAGLGPDGEGALELHFSDPSGD